MANMSLSGGGDCNRRSSDKPKVRDAEAKRRAANDIETTNLTVEQVRQKFLRGEYHR